ncbi:hypothetical protein LPB86_16185 [Pedobacter sp. MC2016-14]|uniref:hypothetical protein n=1 Tax=Pedobacter sp. MC2016-14 TaxID=2897327 RepID=UPI001E61CB2F|nr:hypothetical protein [Pedobacter sp. MC2016-14]MCD0489783.1 hypothetical protein [Pedobacter sp. MC2016-14]
MLGFPKFSKFTVWLVPVTLLIFVIFVIFEDDLFSKNDARELLSKQGMVLNDEFDLLNNKSMIAPGDYYHTFTLKISLEDKQRLIKKITSSNNFKNIGEHPEDIMAKTDHYTGVKLTQNYETESQFISEFFEPRGKGFSPIYRKIEIGKKEGLLIFEDIDF